MLLGKLSFKLRDYSITTFSFVEILPINLSRKLKNFVPFPRNNQSLKDAHIQTQLDDTMELIKIKNFVSDIINRLDKVLADRLAKEARVKTEKGLLMLFSGVSSLMLFSGVS